jgi:uncharacterized protein YuzE
MRVTLDRTADAAMIYLVEIPPGGVAHTYPCDDDEAAAAVNLDFDRQGRLIGIEVIPASKGLPIELLNEAELLGR